MARREYKGAAESLTTSGTLAASGALAFTSNETPSAGWPTGAGGKFLISVDRGLASEEKMLATSRSGSSFVVASGDRGYDGTVAQSHASGAALEHVLGAVDLDEPNDHIFDTTNDDHTQYLNVARHDDVALHTIGDELPAASVFAAAVLPAGLIMPYAGASAPTGWLLCDGSTVAQATYPDLFAITGHTFGADPGGGNFILPNMKGKVPVGIDAAQTEFDTRGETGGAKTHALTLGETGAHSHTVNSHSHGGVTGSGSAAHTHQGIVIEASDESHTHGKNVSEDTWAAGPDQTDDSGTANTLTSTSTAHTHSVSAEAPGTNSAGSGTAHNNLQPYVALNYIIKAA